QGFVLDVCESESVTRLINTLKVQGKMPSILVNNAGVTRDALLLTMKPDDWETVIATNLSAVYRLTQLCLQPMLKARAGRIINISSVIGVTGNAGQANYAAAK